MKNLRKIYLILVSISFTMNMVWTFFREIYWSNFSEEVQRLLQVDGYGSVMPGAENLFILIFLASILCYAGLLFFKIWAVWLLVGLDVVVLILLAPFAGVEISAPVERIAKTLFMMADGAIIALALLTDLRSKFSK